MQNDEGHLNIEGSAIRLIRNAAGGVGKHIGDEAAQLFEGSIAENIRLARPEADDAAWREAAAAAQVDEIAERLGGWEAPVREGATTSPAASANASASPAPCSRTRRSFWSTRRRAASIRSTKSPSPPPSPARPPYHPRRCASHRNDRKGRSNPLRGRRAHRRSQ